MAVCAALLVAAIVAGTSWSGRPFRSPSAGDLPPVEVVRRFVWYVSLALLCGVVVGICVIGGGGRLAMRLLAVTAGDGAQGKVTEADEVVGRITVGGTIGFVVFNGIFGGVTGAGLYLVVRRFLPRGRLGGIVFGLGLLVVMGTAIDPLRRDNPDFDIVGPGWVAVLVFTALAVTFGFVLAGAMARLSEWLPQPATERRVLVRYAGPAIVAAVGFSITVGLAALCAVVVGVTRWRPLPNAVRSHRWVLAGRVVCLVVLAVAMPAALASVVDIVGR